jgi:hypothetical protein
MFKLTPVLGMQCPHSLSHLRRTSKSLFQSDDSDASQDLAIYSRYFVFSKNMAFSRLPLSSLTPFCRRRSLRQHV